MSLVAIITILKTFIERYNINSIYSLRNIIIIIIYNIIRKTFSSNLQ